jgi:peptidoglycan/xylan/chitin deacetylase (PgdA/CDA1 family)
MPAPQCAGILEAVREREDVEITFDDSNESDFTIALPLLKERKLSARFFVVANRVDQPDYMSSRQVQTLCAEGMTVGSHGLDHRPWPELSGEELQAELVGAKRRLEEVCGRPVTEAACPFGRYDRRVLQGLKAAGFQRVYTSDRGPAVPGAWFQPRISLCRADDAERVSRLLCERHGGWKAMTRQLKLALKRWR